MVETAVTLNDLIKFAVIIMACWSFLKVIGEIVKAIVERDKKEQKWNSINPDLIKKDITDKYDAIINNLNKKIDDNHTEVNAKLQEVKAELFLLTECTRAILDGLKQLNCNGPVTEAKHKLDIYLNEKAHD